MPTIIVSDLVHRLICSDARGPFFEDTAKNRGDGTWSIPVDEEVYHALRSLAFPGESDSDVLWRRFMPKGLSKIH